MGKRTLPKPNLFLKYPFNDFSTRLLIFSNLLIILFALVENWNLFDVRDEKKQNIGRVLFSPYARIIPMHLTILFGWIVFNALGEKVALVLFLILKTIADVIMHVREHRYFSQKRTS